MPDAGALVVLALDVAWADTDTIATARAYSPAGVAEDLVVAPVDGSGRGKWQANLVPSTAGEWRVRWDVTGSGQGVTWDVVAVAPAPALEGAGRVYATTAQLADHTGEAPAPGSARALLRASREVDKLLRAACYPVDEQGMPTDPRHAEAMAEATCAQVEWWDEIGDERGTGAAAVLAGSAQIGTVRLSGGSASSSSAGAGGYAPAAVSALRAAGLTGQGPRLPGASWESLR